MVPALSCLGSGLPQDQLTARGTPQPRPPASGSGLLLLSAAISLQTSESLLMLALVATETINE